MRYEGSKETVKQIESTIRKNAMCFERRPKTYDNEFGVESAVKTLVLDVLIPKQAYLFPVRFLYDNRIDSMSVVDVRDKDVWWLCKVAPDVLQSVAQLQPQVNEKQEMLKGTRRENAQYT